MRQIFDKITLKNILKVRYIVIFIFTLSSSFSVAQTTAFTYVPEVGSTTFPNLTLGIRFTVNSTIQVTSLGIWDKDGDGLGEPHIATLYNNTGPIALASVTIPASTGATLIGDFRYADLLTPVTLVPGEYTVAVHYPSTLDAFRLFSTTTSGSEISYLVSTVSTGNIFPELSITDVLGGIIRIAGLNFQYRLPAAAVPTLSQWGILIFGLSLLAMGLVVVYNVQSSRKLVLSGYGGAEAQSGINMGRFNIPFDVDKYKLNLVWSAGLAVLGFAAIYIIWGKIISDDIIGMSITVPVVSYVLYLMKEK